LRGDKSAGVAHQPHCEGRKRSAHLFTAGNFVAYHERDAAHPRKDEQKGSTLRVFTADEVHAGLGYDRLVPALREAFRHNDVEKPLRNVHQVASGDTPAHLLTMPAWREGDMIGVKLVTVFPGNSARGLSAVSSVYGLFSGETGQPLAIIDGEALTNRRTAAASALASTYLSREDAGVLLVVGTGNLARHLAEAHAAMRPISRVLVWGRNAERAEAMSAELRAKGLNAERVDDLSAATAQADIVTCATTSRQPLVKGADLSPGAHVDLVGAFTPQMRETDDAAVLRASVFVDTYAGAFAEAGDLLQAVTGGGWSTDRTRAELHELAAGLKPGRRSADEITLFKSVGTALEDLAAAKLLLEGQAVG
jgi:ornithine cyclodeaminase/alanine dehydrogenase-like protein (mu-crystallin family)